MNDTFFSFIQQFIPFFVARYSFKKILIFSLQALFKFKIPFIQNNAVLFIQKIIHFFEKSLIDQGYLWPARAMDKDSHSNCWPKRSSTTTF